MKEKNQSGKYLKILEEKIMVGGSNGTAEREGKHEIKMKLQKMKVKTVLKTKAKTGESKEEEMGSRQSKGKKNTKKLDVVCWSAVSVNKRFYAATVETYLHAYLKEYPS